MIASSTELHVAVRQLRIMEMALAALREQLQSANPWLFKVTSPAYVRRIGALQHEIAQYFAIHPTTAFSVLQRLEQMEEPAYDARP